MNETVHVEVFLKNEKEIYLAYEIVDDDECILFTPLLLKECLTEFANADRVLLMPVDLIKERFEKTKNVLPDHIKSKIQHLIGYIIKNELNYCGIRTVCNV